MPFNETTGSEVVIFFPLVWISKKHNFSNFSLFLHTHTNCFRQEEIALDRKNFLNWVRLESNNWKPIFKKHCGTLHSWKKKRFLYSQLFFSKLSSVCLKFCKCEYSNFKHLASKSSMSEVLYPPLTAELSVKLQQRSTLFFAKGLVLHYSLKFGGFSHWLEWEQNPSWNSSPPWSNPWQETNK